MSEHKPNINTGFLAKHSLNLVDLSEANTKCLEDELSSLPWMDRVTVTHNGHKVKLEYDASSHNIDEMIKIIEKYGASIKDSWWDRTKLSWQRQTDENIKDNARHQPHCCNKMPPQYRK